MRYHLPLGTADQQCTPEGFKQSCHVPVSVTHVNTPDEKYRDTQTTMLKAPELRDARKTPSTNGSAARRFGLSDARTMRRPASTQHGRTRLQARKQCSHSQKRNRAKVRTCTGSQKRNWQNRDRKRAYASKDGLQRGNQSQPRRINQSANERRGKSKSNQDKVPTGSFTKFSYFISDALLLHWNSATPSAHLAMRFVVSFLSGWKNQET